MGNGAENRPRRWPLLPVRSVGESGIGQTLAGPSPAGGSRAIFMPNEPERITGPAAARDGERRRSSPCSGPRAVYGKLTNRSLRSVAFAASRIIGVTPKISCIVRSVELWS